MLRAAIYTRISQDSAGLGLGVERQRRDCTALCEAQGWTIVETLIENDTSAFSGKPRPFYRRLLGLIEARSVDVVVVWHPDRLHRSPVELEHFIDVIEAADVRVVSVSAGEFDLGTPEGRLTARITGAVARKESEDKSRRASRKHVELAEAGKVGGGGQRPFGFESDRVTIREAEAAEIRRAAARLLAGDSVRSIVAAWNERVPSVTGTAWSATTVRRLLASPRIAGQRSHLGTVTAAAVWPAIIDEDTSMRLRALLASPSAGSGPATARSYLLGGWVWCECGVRMSTRPVIRKGHRYRRYFCAPERGGGCQGGIGAEPLEVLVVDRMFLWLDSPELAARVAKARPAPARSAGATVGQLEERLGELADLFADGKISAVEWTRARARLESRLAAAVAAVATEVRSEVGGQWVGRGVALRAAWEDLSLDQRRVVLARVLERVTIARTTRANNRFDPARVTTTWL